MDWDQLLLPPATLLTLCLAAVVVWVARAPLRRLMNELGVRKVGGLGFDVEFIEHQAAVAYVDQGLDPPSEQDRRAIRRTAEHLGPLARGTRVLWVDNQPRNNERERSAFLAWQVDVQTRRTTDQALCELRDPREQYDLVVTDWRRPGDSECSPAGLELINRMRDRGLEEPVIFYHGAVPLDELERRRAAAKAAGAIGATGSPGELFRWSLMQLARDSGGGRLVD